MPDEPKLPVANQPMVVMTIMLNDVDDSEAIVIKHRVEEILPPGRFRMDFRITPMPARPMPGV